MNRCVATLLDDVERRRQSVSRGLSAKHRASFGQFFTPSAAAGFLAALLELPKRGSFHLLDPGAGVGSLSAAVVARVIEERPDLELRITAFEIDGQLIPPLTQSLGECAAVAARRGVSVQVDIRQSSFIEYATGRLLEQPQQFDAVIANPPYRKVNTNAPERVAAEKVGLRASNLYTIFTGLAADLMIDGGQMSAIIPRSWANGPYHEPFRRFLFERLSLDYVHVYENRGKVFSDTDVLQENVVIHAVRATQAETITLSTGAGGRDPRVEREVPVDEVLHPDDPHAFLHLPVDERATCIAERLMDLPATLGDLDVQVSTGRVVDFRARAYLRDDPADDTVPLVYPGHLRGGRVAWPTPHGKKPDALQRSAHTEALLLPNETYVLVKRFSAKEERRRVVAAVSGPRDLPGDVVGYENHLNVYHRGGRGLPLLLALGLSAYLNCTLVDDYVRSFSGHTQINATDLRQLRYPSSEELVGLGGVLVDRSWPGQSELDELVAEHLPTVSESSLAFELAT